MNSSIHLYIQGPIGERWGISFCFSPLSPSVIYRFVNAICDEFSPSLFGMYDTHWHSHNIKLHIWFIHREIDSRLKDEGQLYCTHGCLAYFSCPLVVKKSFPVYLHNTHQWEMQLHWWLLHNFKHIHAQLFYISLGWFWLMLLLYIYNIALHHKGCYLSLDCRPLTCSSLG